MEMPEMAVLTVYNQFTQSTHHGRQGSGGKDVAPIQVPVPKGFGHQGTPLYVVEMPEMRVLTLYITLTQPLDLAGHSSRGGGVSPLPLPLLKGFAHQGTTLNVMEMPEMTVLTLYI
jgi:hypothetical protein